MQVVAAFFSLTVPFVLPLRTIPYFPSAAPLSICAGSPPACSLHKIQIMVFCPCISSNFSLSPGIFSLSVCRKTAPFCPCKPSFAVRPSVSIARTVYFVILHKKACRQVAKNSFSRHMRNKTTCGKHRRSFVSFR